MKLKNKRTGEIVDTLCSDDITKGISFGIDHHDGNPTMAYYNSLAELYNEWEDYEEPKEYWTISGAGHLWTTEHMSPQTIDDLRQIGNLFETKEEAEKAVEKLKALKRLKDKGFRFDGWDENHHNLGIIEFSFSNVKKSVYDFSDDLGLLFGGEE